MAMLPQPADRDFYSIMRDLKWTAVEKAIARRAFERVLRQELDAAIESTKRRAVNAFAQRFHAKPSVLVTKVPDARRTEDSVHLCPPVACAFDVLLHSVTLRGTRLATGILCSSHAGMLGFE